MKIAQIFALAALALGLQGCVAAGLAVAEAGAGIGIGAGIDHTMNGIVYKTFTASTNELRFATLDALDRMGMTLNTMTLGGFAVALGVLSFIATVPHSLSRNISL